MRIEKLIAIVPLTRIDPDPLDLTERVAQATLSSFQALWHPVLLHRSGSLPVWVRAAEPPVPAPDQLILVPETSRRFLSFAWEEQARAAGAKCIVGEETRDRIVARLWEELPGEFGRLAQTVDAADFMSLGLARLWLEMLTAYMKHPQTLDDDHLQREVLAAASAATLGDSTTRDDHLRASFQLIAQAREQLYSADVHLLDFCLLDPRAGLDRLGQQLSCGQAVNIFASGRTIESLREKSPAVSEQLKTSLQETKSDLVGGEFDEVASTLLPLESHLWQFGRGERSYRDVLDRTPTIFGRRRFGFARHMLQIANRLEFHFLTHFCFDDGVFPTRADPKVRWEAPDTTTMETLARIPFAGDSALEYLKFPWRMAQTMTADFVATLAMVHWPMPETPWYSDLLRMTRYANVFVRFSTLSHYFQTTDPPAISTSLSNDQYSSPFLLYEHQHQSPFPISQFARHHRYRARMELVRWLEAIELAVLRRPRSSPQSLDELEDYLETDPSAASEKLNAAENSSLHRLAELISPASKGSQPGLLVFNPLGFDRNVTVTLDLTRPSAGESLDPTGDSSPPRVAAFSVPAMGFAWVDMASPPAASATDRKAATVIGETLRNEFMEVELDEKTGGIRSVRDPHQRAPLLGQQLVLVGTPHGQDYTADGTPGTDGYGMSGYGSLPINSEMRATSTTVRSAGPELAEVVVEGELLAQPCPTWASQSRMARFRQTFRLIRGQPTLRVTTQLIELVHGAIDGQASPWHSYLASRFAWPDPQSLLIRGVGSLAEASRSQRPESPYFVEIHGRKHRVAILPGGLPFHQKHSERMLDMLLITATETVRTFEFAIGLDLPNPFQAALDLITPPAMIACNGPPACGSRGWFFHLDASNIVITSLSPLHPDRCGVRLRLFESAGRYTRARLQCLRTVTEARMTDFHGQRLASLESEGDRVTLDLSPHEFTQLEIEFA